MVKNIPLLRDILPGPDPRPPMSISLLARELNVPVSRVLPLVEEGYIRRIGPETVEAPSAAGLAWLRSWFQPALAKPLFSQKDIAELLEIEDSAVPRLLAAHDVPICHDAALGLTVSLWGVRRLLLEVLSTGTRFDRQALLWFLVGDPSRLCPPFDDRLEKEIERIAQLPEPTKTRRREMLLKQWRDASAASGVETSANGERLKRQFTRLNDARREKSGPKTAPSAETAPDLAPPDQNKPSQTMPRHELLS